MIFNIVVNNLTIFTNFTLFCFQSANGFGANIVVLMFIRIYLVLRALHDYSQLYVQRNAIVRRMNMANMHVGFDTVLKTYYNLHSLLVL